MPDAVPASPSLSPPAPPRVWFQLGGVPFTTARLVTIGCVIAALVLLALFWRRIDIEALHAQAQALPGAAVIGVIALAPMVGVPVAMLHVVAGVRFGIVGGLLVVAATTVLHHLIGYGLVRLAPQLFATRLAAWRERFPHGAHLPMTVLSCLLPGMPYVVQMYLLPVLGVPLGILLTVSAPLHVLRAVISVVGGELSDELTPARIAGLVLYYVLLMAICAYTLRRIRQAMAAGRA